MAEIVSMDVLSTEEIGRRLKEALDASGMTVKAVADKSGILRQTLYNRLAGQGEFTVKEMVALCNAMRLTAEERDYIFFTL